MTLIVKEIAPGYNAASLLEAYSKAYSIENCSAHGIDVMGPVFIGKVYDEECPNRLYALYQYGETYWYKTFIQAGSAEIELYEAVFGRKDADVDRRRKRGKR